MRQRIESEFGSAQMGHPRAYCAGTVRGTAVTVQYETYEVEAPTEDDALIRLAELVINETRLKYPAAKAWKLLWRLLPNARWSPERPLGGEWKGRCRCAVVPPEFVLDPWEPDVGEISEFERKRIERATDSRDVSPAQLLRLIAYEIESNPGEFADGVVVVLRDRTTDPRKISVWASRANCTREEELALLVIAQQRVLENWRRS